MGDDVKIYDSIEELYAASGIDERASIGDKMMVIHRYIEGLGYNMPTSIRSGSHPETKEQRDVETLRALEILAMDTESLEFLN